MTEADKRGTIAAALVVVGAGPAGLAAALAAAQAGVDVLLLDAAPAAGGQIWRARRGVPEPQVDDATTRLARLGGRVLAGARVSLVLPDCTLLLDTPHGALRVRWQRLVLATGARERLLPFPGWTLPGVFGAGGLQALVKGGWPIAGQRVVVAGSGPLLVAAAATLRGEGAQIAALAEEAGPAGLARFAGTLLARPAKLAQAARLGVALAGVAWYRGWRVVAAVGPGRVEQVQLERHGRTRTVDCDALAAGWGLVPQVELGQALGCATALRFGAEALVADGAQRTSVAGVFAAGECTGVAGARAAQWQGEIAGLTVAAELAGGPGAPVALRRRLAREHAFAAAVARTFAAPTQWHTRLRDDTLVCRCEDVRWAALRTQPDLRAAKLATRCGMGHCQGRLCHDALAAVQGWSRLPAGALQAPAPLGALLACDANPHSQPDTDPVHQEN